jgi:hypothetical protein
MTSSWKGIHEKDNRPTKDEKEEKDIGIFNGVSVLVPTAGFEYNTSGRSLTLAHSCFTKAFQLAQLQKDSLKTEVSVWWGGYHLYHRQVDTRDT